jgi:hypothetical protein
MKLRAVRIDKKFIPEWNGNKDLQISEQIAIYFSRIPGTSEKKNYVSWSTDGKGKISIEYNDMMLLSTFVSKIDNLEIENPENGNVDKIKNGVDLANAAYSGLDVLFNEIRDYLFPAEDEVGAGE